MAVLRHTASGTVMSQVPDESVSNLVSLGWEVHEHEVELAEPTPGADDNAKVGDAPADVEVGPDEPKVEQAPRRRASK